MRKFFIILIGVLMMSGSYAQTFKAGAALRNITPDPLLPLSSGGIGKPTPSTKKLGDLFVRALVIEKGDTRVAIVNVDNMGWPAVVGDRSRALIKGIPVENILIGASHTHSAPDAYAFPDAEGNVTTNFEYLDWCVEMIAEAVNEALAKLEPASLKIAVGEAKGKIALNYYAEKLYDPRCGVIQAISKNGNTIATLLNYATHPEIIGDNEGITTPDLCGPLYTRLEEKAGGVALFMNGAQGGMVSADDRGSDGKSMGTWEECVRIGELMADEALRIVANAEVQENPDVLCDSKVIELPVESETMQFILKHSTMGYKTTPNMGIETRINLLNIGTAQILTIPGEALPNIGFYLKRKMNTQHPFLFGLTNDAFGYIMTKVDFDSFERYRYISGKNLGEMTGEIYIEEALQLVNDNPVAVAK